MAKITKRPRRTDAGTEKEASRARPRRKRATQQTAEPTTGVQVAEIPTPPPAPLPTSTPARVAPPPATLPVIELTDFSAGIFDSDEIKPLRPSPAPAVVERKTPPVVLEVRAPEPIEPQSRVSVDDFSDDEPEVFSTITDRRDIQPRPMPSRNEPSRDNRGNLPVGPDDRRTPGPGNESEDRPRGRRRRGRGRGRGRGRKLDEETTKLPERIQDERPPPPADVDEDKDRTARIEEADEEPWDTDLSDRDDGDDELPMTTTEDRPAAARAPADGRRDGRRRDVDRSDVDRRDAYFDEDADELDEEPTGPTDDRVMLINVADPDECRIGLLRNGRLDELYMERATSTSHVGNIYKGRVTNVEASIQAAFIDFGLPSHGFLHISDLHPMYFPNGKKNETEMVGRKTPRRQRPPIQACLRRGQEVIVQIIKEGIGTKGPTLTSYISLPGRFLVMMPGMDQLGVSRKIEDEEQRRELRQLLGELSLPKDMGFIVRTAGIGRNKRELQRDLNYLVRLWKKVRLRLKSEPAPAELYQESDLVIRTIRDVYDSSIGKIVVDSKPVADSVREFLTIASPRMPDIVEYYAGTEPIFHKFGLEAEIDKLHSRHVPLNCGGSLVIEQTEALVAIDVNSGRFRVPDNAEETAYRVNVEAVDEIARQLRLRDLGGLIICDFIDMLQERHRRDIEQRLRDALKKHKERAKILRMSKFGIIELTRQRQRPSFAKSMFRDCPQCAGTGRLKATESVALDVMRQIRLASQREGIASVDVRVSTAVANDLLNRKRHQLTDLERTTSQTIRIHGEHAFLVDQVEISCTDRRGREINAAAGSPGPNPTQAGGPPPGGGGRHPPHQDRNRRSDGRPQSRGRGQHGNHRGGPPRSRN